MAVDHVDVLIVGAGISGIGAACHLTDSDPTKSYAIVEARGASGGTWDLFRYPGVRSDSDMHTLGFRFRPWRAADSIADGPAILDYLRDTARAYDVDRHIRYHHKVVNAEWSSDTATWNVEIARTDIGETTRISCNFLFMCSGYYNYDKGYQPEFPGVENYRGTFLHPQHWPEDLDYAGKKVVIIGSGATAVTLVPAMAESAEHVTMLQRSPTYIIAQPKQDPLDIALNKVLPRSVTYPIVRWKNVLTQAALYTVSQRAPKIVKSLLRKGVVAQLPDGFDVDTHFTPDYNPWDQRLCLVPDGDLFAALSNGSASVVTEHIETFTPNGIRLRNGEELEADIVVSATGLNLQAFGGTNLTVDGEDVKLPETVAYRGTMISGVPNFAYVFGYVNASWTLKADLIAEYVCKLLKHMDENGYSSCTPVQPDASIERRPLLDFDAGYIQRAVGEFPRQGAENPWQVRMSYLSDLISLRTVDFDDTNLEYSGTVAASQR